MKLWIMPMRTSPEMVSVFTHQPALMPWMMGKAQRPVIMPNGETVEMDEWAIHLPRPFVQDMVLPALIPEWPDDDSPSVLCVELEAKPVSIAMIEKLVEPPAPPAGKLF